MIAIELLGRMLLAAFLVLVTLTIAAFAVVIEMEPVLAGLILAILIAHMTGLL